ncbi:MAG: bifunctional DNA-formamidopyrimidine glycosylase/DNA-(apurinic or apyrimidinic site) lyase [bacterium]|nr:bifunctional DNA-formamidopyrimidine glycosylase/DNA-(apurinic or apyrimidinic site) lyase [bacterium]
MPELPEVETVARQLDLVLPGRRLRALRVLDPKLAALSSLAPRLRGGRWGPVRRSGKRVILPLMGCAQAPDGWLAVHLRMTGRLLATEADAPDPPHLRLVLELDQGRLCFADSRRFGTVEWLEREEELAPPGLDPFDPACTAARLAEMARPCPGPLKGWLLDQRRICGLGNIYACEILHAAGLSPHRPASSLTRGEWTSLRRHMRAILTRAIALCGTTFSDFQDSRGLEGSFGRLLKVYRRQGGACPRCGGELWREVVAGRGTFWCPGCQH